MRGPLNVKFSSVLFNVARAESFVIVIFVHQHCGPSCDARSMSFRLIAGSFHHAVLDSAVTCFRRKGRVTTRTPDCRCKL